MLRCVIAAKGWRLLAARPPDADTSGGVGAAACGGGGRNVADPQQAVGGANYTASEGVDATQGGDKCKGAEGVYIPLQCRRLAAVRLLARIPFWVGLGARRGLTEAAGAKSEQANSNRHR